MQCLNHMICNAAQHAPRCLEYMQQLRNPQVFSFCAIPQIMAIATLALCYNNGDVFEGVVKMRRGQTACVRPPTAVEVSNMQSRMEQRLLSCTGQL